MKYLPLLFLVGCTPKPTYTDGFYLEAEATGDLMTIHIHPAYVARYKGRDLIVIPKDD